MSAEFTSAFQASRTLADVVNYARVLANHKQSEAARELSSKLPVVAKFETHGDIEIDERLQDSIASYLKLSPKEIAQLVAEIDSREAELRKMLTFPLVRRVFKPSYAYHGEYVLTRLFTSFDSFKPDMKNRSLRIQFNPKVNIDFIYGLEQARTVHSDLPLIEDITTLPYKGYLEAKSTAIKQLSLPI